MKKLSIVVVLGLPLMLTGCDLAAGLSDVAGSFGCLWGGTTPDQCNI